MGDYQKKNARGQKAADPVTKAMGDEEAYQAFEVWCEDSGDSGEAAKEDAFSTLNRLLSALEETGTRVNVSTYPPVQYESDMMGTSSI